MNTYYEVMQSKSDEQYLALLLESVKNSTLEGVEMPGFPDGEIQKQFVGSTNEHALLEAYHFYIHVKSYCEALGKKINRSTRILDFGCGWGRITRFFLKDILPENVFGVDVDWKMVCVCRNTVKHGTYFKVNANPPTIFRDECFDVVIAYSVFSHLSEKVAKEWVKEIARTLVPGGVLLATTQGRCFLDFCDSLRGENQESAWHRALAKSFIPLEAAKALYDSGKFLFSPTGGGDVRDSSFYGEALISKQYVENNYSEHLAFRDFVDDQNRLPQALFVMQKR